MTQEFPTHKECHLKREKERRKRENINYKTCKKFCCGLWQPIHGCYCYCCCCCCCSPFYESVLEAFELFDTFLHTFLSDQLFYRRGACFLKSFFYLFTFFSWAICLKIFYHLVFNALNVFHTWRFLWQLLYIHWLVLTNSFGALFETKDEKEGEKIIIKMINKMNNSLMLARSEAIKLPSLAAGLYCIHLCINILRELILISIRRH